jgi:hypothetical protein
MEPVKMTIKVKRVSLMYVLANYLLFIGGLLVLSYAIYKGVYQQGQMKNPDIVFIGFFLGLFGIAKGGRIVYGDKVLRRNR